jgi:hypothetical protein
MKTSKIKAFSNKISKFSQTIFVLFAFSTTLPCNAQSLATLHNLGTMGDVEVVATAGLGCDRSTSFPTLLKFPSLVLSPPPTSPPVPTTAWEYNETFCLGDRPPSIPHSDTNTADTPSHSV